MSEASRAWSWRHAFASSDLPAISKAVLHTLGMFMNELGEGCYPSVADICRYSGYDKKTVLKYLAVARDAGWIGVSQHGYRGQKWKRQEYSARWPERDLVAACAPDAEDAADDEGGGSGPPPSTPQKVVEPRGEGGGREGSKVVDDVHQDKTTPVTTPDTSPSERGRAGAGEQAMPASETPGRADFEKRVMRFCSGRGFHAGPWPDWDTGASPGWIAKQFAALSIEERGEAERWRDAYLLDIAARKQAPVAVGNFMSGKLWTGLDPAILDRAEKQRHGRLAPGDVARPDGWASCLGPVGMAWLFDQMLKGPKDAAAMAKPFLSDGALRDAWPELWWFQATLRQRGGAVFDAAWHAVKPSMEPVPRGSAVLAAWREEFAARGWKWLPAFDGMDVVYCPKGGPDGLVAFEHAVSVAKSGTAKGCEDDGRQAAE